jgi:signal transduction histidine kinase/ActR/RegA family two-component response regulator
MKRIPLRRRLFLLAAAGVLPLAIMSAIALYAQYQQTREQAQRAGLDVARALSTAVDAELRRTLAVLEVLATSSALEGGNLALFHTRMERLRKSQPHWRAVLLHDLTGAGVLSTREPPGTPLPALREKDSFEEVVRTGQPRVGMLNRRPTGEWSLPFRAPVVLGGKMVYVLTAVVDPDAVRRVLERQQVPGEWVVAVSDRYGLRVARTRSALQSLGTPFSSSLVELMAQGGDSGRGITLNSEGDSVFTAYVRSPESRWVTAVGLPVGAVEGPAWQTFITFGSGIALSLLLGALAAMGIARSINRPMAQLRDSALSGGGEAMAAPETSIREIQDVANALVASESARAVAAEEREALLRSERAARTVAENANRAKDEFLAMLGHELRNPLSAISNAASVLEHAGVDPDRQRDARAVINRQVGHLTRLTDDLLDAGRALMGKIVLQRRPVDLGLVAAQTLVTLDAAGRTRKHEVTQELGTVWVDADPIRLDQVISNLVINAAKYTAVGGRIAVKVTREGNDAVLRVKDDGIGIPAELAARVFDLFVQGDRELDRALGGLGIGLTLVRRLAQLHGGTAEVASAGEGRGSEFTVRLPAIEPPALAKPARAETRYTAGRDILVIEDNDDARETLKLLLEMSGHRVSAAADGQAGLDAALASHPEVLLIDIGLPKLDGYEVARRIRAANGWPRRPLLVAVTGYGLPEDRDKALAAGFDAHMPKPVSPQALEELLQRSGDAISP